MHKAKRSQAALQTEDPLISLPYGLMKTKWGKKLSKIKKILLKDRLHLLFFLATIFGLVIIANLTTIDRANASKIFPQETFIFKAQPVREQSTRIINYQIESQKFELNFQLPLKEAFLSQSFTAYHPAIDLAASYGADIYPIAAGEVKMVGWDLYGKGKIILIDHGNGFSSLYAHLSKIEVLENEFVDEKRIIGKIGSTGHSTGAHLHLEINDQNSVINPQNLIPVIN